MARGRRKSVEDKIKEKEELIHSLQLRIKNESKELETLYEEKDRQDMKCITELLRTAKITADEAVTVLQNYVSENNAAC